MILLIANGFEQSSALSSTRSYNLKVLGRLSKNELKEVQRIVSMHFIAEKFRKPIMKKYVLDGELESIARALAGKRLSYVYLIWKNPKFKKSPDPMSQRERRATKR